jgi:ketosteroid isomerase-like protein
MTPAEIAASFFSLVEHKQLDAAFALLADDLVVKGPAPKPLGKREYTAVHGAWAKACSDWRFNWCSMEDLGDGKVRATIGITATLDGELVGLPVPGLPERVSPTGRKAKLPAEHPVMTIRGGKITALEFVTPEGGGVPGLLAQFGVSRAQ